MDHQIFIDRILENESLAGDLEDAPAEQLLRWGTGQVRALVQELSDAELAGAKVNELMATMRQVNRTASSCAGASADDLAAQLGRLLERHAQAVGGSGLATADDLAKAAAALRDLAPDQAVAFLLEWLDARKG